MAKFKRGDRVVNPTGEGCSMIDVGHKGTVIGYDGSHFDELLVAVDWDGAGKASVFERRLELITDEPKFKFKVGDRVRVLKDQTPKIGCAQKGETGVVDEDHKTPWVIMDKDGRKAGVSQDDLELIKEGETISGAYNYVPYRIEDFTPIDLIAPTDFFTGDLIAPTDFFTGDLLTPIKKQTLKQKTMNFIKKLTQSKDDKTLEKARFFDSCGDLTNRGREALLSLVFQEKKEALVKLAEEVIEEEKGDE